MLRQTRAFAFVLLALAGCSDALSTSDAAVGDASPSTTDGAVTDASRLDASTSDGGEPDAVCPDTREEMVDGERIVVCLRGYDAPPFIHLPPDASDIVYGGILAGETGPVLRTRERDLALPPDGAIVREAAMSSAYAYHLYRARLEGGTPTEIVPVVRVDDSVMQRMLEGLVIEGFVSGRSVVGGDVRYELEPMTIGVRIRLDDSIDIMPRTAEVTGVDRYALRGTIENATSGVRSADGTCIPALSELGERSPLATATDDRVLVLRHPNMHGVMDDVFTLDWPDGTTTANNMGVGLFVPTADLIRSTAPVLERADCGPHGVPWGGPHLNARVVSGGGEPCTP